MTGLALTTTVGIAATPAAEAVGPTLTSADRQHDDDKNDNKGKGRSPEGTPVPCDANALIAAITLANARGGAALDLAKKCTYLLTTDLDGAGLPAITTPITLNGGKHTAIERAAAADPFRILTVNTGGNLTLNKLKITGGQTTPGAPGGGILVNPGGELTAKHSEIVGNIATFNVGGGISNRGTTTIKDSTVSRNTSRQGGGIFNTGRLTAGKVTFADNGVTGFGGGISSTSSGTAEVSDSTFTRNRALGGAGIGDSSGVITTVVRSTFTDNSATALGGGIFIDGQLTLRKVTIVNNTAPTQGAGVVIQNSSGGSSAVIEDSKISNNTTVGGGGGIINVFAPLVLRDTKIEGNQADTGGGLLTLFNSTSTLFNTAVVKNIAVNDGGGIFNDPAAVVVLNSFTGTVVIKNRPNNCVNVPGCAG